MTTHPVPLRINGVPAHHWPATTELVGRLCTCGAGRAYVRDRHEAGCGYRRLLAEAAARVAARGRN